jgi:hypothetical protein
LESPKGRDNSGDLKVDGRTILKWISGKQGSEVNIGLYGSKQKQWQNK